MAMKESKRQAAIDLLLLVQLYAGAFAIYRWASSSTFSTPFWLESIAGVMAVGAMALPLAFLLRLNRSHQKSIELDELKSRIHRKHGDVRDTNL